MEDRPEIEEFQGELVMEGLAERTARLYAGDVEAFFAGTDGGAREGLAPGRIRRWLDQLADEGHATSTITRRLTALRRYCRWLVGCGKLAADPTEGISVSVSQAPPPPAPDHEDHAASASTGALKSLGRLWRRLAPGDEEAERADASPISAAEVCRSGVSSDDITAVLTSPDYMSAIGLRDRAMMALLVDTGMELRELCALNYHECTREGDQLIVGEGRRLRRVYLLSAHRPLRCYIYEVRQLQTGDALFLSVRGKRISERAVQHRVRHYATREGVTLTVKDLIERGRLVYASEDAGDAARRLGFARPDALERRYRVTPEAGGAPSPEEIPPHPFLKPLKGMHPGGLPRRPDRPAPPPSRSEIWDRLEWETGQRMRLPHPAEECCFSFCDTTAYVSTRCRGRRS